MYRAIAVVIAILSTPSVTAGASTCVSDAENTYVSCRKSCFASAANNGCDGRCLMSLKDQKKACSPNTRSVSETANETDDDAD